ncbi:MAG: hypothetical protein M1830_000514 [Pleopsidium flavum]|nr:MAG: hypothetical protein M1830_000514 [Pleopsidium flavum]
MSTPAAKRRRLDSASRTLSKPFVSPFKTPVKAKPAHDDTPDTTTGEEIEEIRSENPVTNPSQHTTTTPSKPAAPKAKPHPLPTTISPSKDPDLAALSKTHRTLETQLRALTTDLDTLSQAVKIESSNSDTDLEALIQKWKTASREAAEEVFAGVRDRVNRMGGVGAWRDAQRKQQEWKSGGFGFDDGPGRKGVDEEGVEGDISEGERERRRAEAEDQVDGREVDGEGKKAVVEEEEEGADDDTFTMDMMLRSLNVELDVIGFDKESQRWID